VNYKSSVFTLLFLAEIIGLSGCGKDKANAARDFSGVKNAPLSAAAATTSQNTGALGTSTGGMKISLLNSNDNKLPIFQEGLPGSLKFKLTIYDKTITQASIVAVHGSCPATIVQGEDSSTFVMNWTPPVGTVDRQSGTLKSKDQNAIMVQVSVYSIASHLGSGTAISNGEQFDTSIVVTKSSGEPKVLSNDRLDNKINKKTDFIVWLLEVGQVSCRGKPQSFHFRIPLPRPSSSQFFQG